MIPTIEINTDVQTCAQCNKKGKGFYKNKQGKYVCHKCVLKNIKTMSIRDKKTKRIRWIGSDTEP